MFIISKKKVLLITQYFTPEVNAAAFRLKDLYENLEEKKDIDLKVITTYPHKNKLDQDYDFTEEKNITRIKIPQIKNNKFFKYIFEYFYFIFISLFKVFSFSSQVDYVIITSPPLFVSILGYIVSKIKKAKFIVDIRDLWPDTVVATGIISKGSLSYKLAKSLEKFTYRKADYIFCVSKNVKKHINKYKSNNVEIIYNGVSKQTKNMIDYSLCKNNTSLEKLKIYYAGNIGLLQNLELLLKSFAKDSKLTQMYSINFIGDGAEKSRLENYCKEHKLENVKFLGSLPKKDTLNLLYEDANILFINLKNEPILRSAIPSKLFDYLLLNKPILYGIEEEAKDILDKLECGLYFNNDNINSLINSLHLIYKNYNYYYNNSENNSEFVMNNYNRKKQFDKIYDVIVGENA